MPQATLVVLGEVPGAAGLLRYGNVAVTGPVEPGEFATTAAHHGVSRLFAERRVPLFAHPLIEAAATAGLPLAFRDWSFGAPACAPGPCDLAITPTAAPPEVAAALSRWMT